MKLALAALCVVAMSLPAARPATACSPAPTCGDDFCRGGTALVEGVVAQLGDPNTAAATVTLQVTAVHGDAAELTVGQYATLQAPWLFGGREQNQSVVLVLSRGTDGELEADQRLDLIDYRVTECFGSADTATIASIVLAPTCETTLDTAVPRQSSGCGRTTMTCSTGRPSGSVLVLGVLACVLRRRRRAR